MMTSASLAARVAMPVVFNHLFKISTYRDRRPVVPPHRLQCRGHGQIQQKLVVFTGVQGILSMALVKMVRGSPWHGSDVGLEQIRSMSCKEAQRRLLCRQCLGVFQCAVGNQ